eukprot:m.35639 g.35639  ORF g.35639 m.35639 type:complete len:157 (-) comp44217_c0_seq1:105-575(-)
MAIKEQENAIRLCLAVRDDQLATCQLIVQECGDAVITRPFCSPGTGWAPLHRAAMLGRLDILKWFLQQRIDVDEYDDRARTALITAAASGQTACLQALLDANANTALLNAYDRTALDIARRQGRTEIVSILEGHEQLAGLRAKTETANASPAAPCE